MKKVVIKVKGAAYAPLGDFNWFQGELKYLPEDNYEALKLSILNLGFSFAITVWFSKDGKMNIVDGHQRVLTLRAMQAEGYDIPLLPYDSVEADSYEEAKRKVLAGASQYGQIQNLGLSEFIADTGITGMEMSQFTVLPGIDPMNLPAPSPEFSEPTEMDTPKYDEDGKDKYDRAMVKAITIHYSQNEYAVVVNRMNDQMEKFGCDDYSQTLLRILDAVEVKTKKA